MQVHRVMKVAREVMDLSINQADIGQYLWTSSDQTQCGLGIVY